MKQVRWTTILSSVLVLTFACGENEETKKDPANMANSNDDLTSGENYVLNLKFSNIERLEGQHYEGWIVDKNGNVTTSGRFNVSETGEAITVDKTGAELESFEKDAINFTLPGRREDIASFVLTIEPNNDPDDDASAVHYLDGDFSNFKTKALSQNARAMNADFSDAAGTYLLATPTNGPDTHNQGIWYLDPTAGPGASLTLPELANGWAYEGWLVNQSTGEVVSTGTFTGASGEDSDGAGAAAGPSAAPSFPGQDYIDPAKILNNGAYTAVISVEPSPDFDPRPFTIKLLASDIAEDAAVETSFTLDNINNQDSVYIEATLGS